MFMGFGYDSVQGIRAQVKREFQKGWGRLPMAHEKKI
jgi:hypothetical protein